MTISLTYRNKMNFMIFGRDYDVVTLINCHYGVVSDCNIGNLTLINSSNNTITDNKVKTINITSTPPQFKYFKKRRIRKWINKYGSNHNTVMANSITEDMYSNHNIWKIS